MLKRCTWLAVTIAVTVGCGRSRVGLPTVPVSGTVMYKGKPLAEAFVVFMNKPKGGRPGSGMTDAQGQFELATFVGGKQWADGALPGDYTVLVLKTEKVDGRAADPSALMNASREELEKMATAFQEGATRMGSTAEQRERIQKAMAGDPEEGPGSEPPDQGSEPPDQGMVAMDPMMGAGPRPKSLIPAEYGDAKQSDLKATVKADGNGPFRFNLTDGSRRRSPVTRPVARR